MIINRLSTQKELREFCNDVLSGALLCVYCVIFNGLTDIEIAVRTPLLCDNEILLSNNIGRINLDLTTTLENMQFVCTTKEELKQLMNYVKEY